MHRTAQLACAALAALGLVVVAPSSQAAPSPQEIIDKASLAYYYAGKDGRSEVRMKIVDGQGRKMRRSLRIIRQDDADGGVQRFLVLLDKPADVRNTVFMVHKKPGGDDDRWLYLPSLDLVKRIAASDKRTSFVGSHIFYEDLSGRSPKADTHTLVETTDTHYVIDSVPKDKGSVEFASYRVSMNKASHLPEKIVYKNAKGDAIRQIEAVRVEDIQGHPTVTRLKISDLASGGYTLAEFREVKYDLGIPADTFVERALRHPPAKWLGDK